METLEAALSWLTGSFGKAAIYLILLVGGFAWITHSPVGETERPLRNRIKKFCRRLTAK
jgi:hypothetical protein